MQVIISVNVCVCLCGAGLGGFRGGMIPAELSWPHTFCTPESKWNYNCWWTITIQFSIISEAVIAFIGTVFRRINRHFPVVWYEDNLNKKLAKQFKRCWGETVGNRLQHSESLLMYPQHMCVSGNPLVPMKRKLWCAEEWPQLKGNNWRSEPGDQIQICTMPWPAHHRGLMERVV